MQTEPGSSNNGNGDGNRDGSEIGARLEFEEVVERYYRPLFQFALGLTHSEADASDLTQQTFYTWSTKGQQLRDASRIKGWMFTTLHRAFLQRRRRETRFPHFELGQMSSELPTIAPSQESQLDSAEVLTVLAQTDEVFRRPLTLFYLEGRPYKEIALALEVPLGTVKSRIARGIAELRRLLTPSESWELKAAA